MTKPTTALNDIVSDLREHNKNGNWWGKLFVLFLLTFTAYNTFRLFGQSFEQLGILLAFAAIGFFDGGFLFWGHQVRKVSKDFSQRGVASVMRWVCAGAAVSMTAIDMVLHSGQDYVALDATVQLYGGWEATVAEVAGASAMFILVGVLIANLMAISLFEDLDIEIKQAIAERVAQNGQKKRELAAFEARSRLQNEMMAEVIKQLATTAQDEIIEESDKLAKEMLPEIRKEFVEHIRQRRNQGVYDGRFSKPNQQINIPAPARAFAKDVDEDNVSNRPPQHMNNNNHRPQQPQQVGGKNRPNPPKA